MPITNLVRIKKKSSISGHFRITDIFSLFFLIQLPIGLLNFVEILTDNVLIVAWAISGTVSLLVWLAAIRSLNHAGVDHQFKRIVCIAYTLPFAIFCGVAFPMVTVSTYHLYFGGDDFGHWSVLPIYLAVLAVTFASSKWIAKSEYTTDETAR